MLAAGYNPVVDFSGLEDLAHPPILTKEILKQTDVRDFVLKSDFGHLDDYFCDVTSGIPRYPGGKIRMLISNAERDGNGMQPFFQASLKG